MLSEADIGPIVAALDDSSRRVQHAALRTIAPLLPLMSGESLCERLREIAESSDAGSRALAQAALQGVSDATRCRTERPQTHEREKDLVASTGPVGTPEQWRKSFDEASDVSGRLHPAMSLAIAGESSWIESLLHEIETAPLNFEALRYVRNETHSVPEACAERLLRIAGDTARRGDVRQIAWLLAGQSKDADKPPYTTDLIEHATELADYWLQGHSFPTSQSGLEFLRYLEPEKAAFLIVRWFDGCLRELRDGHVDQGYMLGNDVVVAVTLMERSFVPDIPALFELYLQAFRQDEVARADWYRTHDDNVIFNSSSGHHLAISWQIAWTVARAQLTDIVVDLACFLDSTDEIERLATLALLEDAIRYVGAYPPQFGGVSCPENDTAVLLQKIASTLPRVSADVGFKTIRVFYGTNRCPTGSLKPSQWFGGDEADLALGICEVSIPTGKKHAIGRMESPSWHTVIHRGDPSRYIILQKVEMQAETDFSKSLRDRVQSSNEKQALIFVHGYRNSFEDAARRTAQLSEDLEMAVPVFYSWPSKARLLSYVADETLAQRAIPALLRFLDLVTEQSGADVIHLIAHSMGAMALTRAVVKYLQARGSDKKPKFREIILAAPDIDVKVFEDEIVPQIAGKGPRLTLYASRRDYALLTSGWLRGGLSRAGFIKGEKPLVIPGVETIDVSAVNTEVVWGLLQGHSYVADRPPVVQDMFELLRSGKCAAERYGHTEAILNNLRYWIMKPRVA